MSNADEYVTKLGPLVNNESHNEVLLSQGKVLSMQHKIHGTVFPTLELLLQPGDSMYSQTHALGWMSDPIRTDTRMSVGGQQSSSFFGGFLNAAKRVLTGGSFFQNVFWAEGAPGLVGFNPRFPGTILVRELMAGESLICRKETFLCATASVTLDLYFRKQFGAGLFGGEGFIMQKVTGPGTVFLDMSGEVVEKTLGVGERLRVHVGHVGIQDPSVSFGIELVAGVKNLMFGGNGVFYAVLTGPGKVQLQSMPIAILAEEIAKHIGDARQPDSGTQVAGDALGGALGIGSELLKDWGSS